MKNVVWRWLPPQITSACARRGIKSRNHQSRSYQRRSRGFTLFELLVAMVIFAVLGNVAYQGLFQTQRVRDSVQETSERLTELRRAFYWLSDDIAQVVDRPVRGSLGSPQPGFIVSQAGDSMLEFTRAGWTNPAGDVSPPRSNLQRVSYQLEGDRLLRRYAYHLDAVDDESTKRRRLLTKVDSVEMRFLDSSGGWHEAWPPSTADPEIKALPAAIEFKFELQEWGEVIRLFSLPG